MDSKSATKTLDLAILSKIVYYEDYYANDLIVNQKDVNDLYAELHLDNPPLLTAEYEVIGEPANDILNGFQAMLSKVIVTRVTDTNQNRSILYQ